ncbi:Hpt domain-containing response regulator [Modestobacter sp. VKM Ac-2985]|uniref:Hpt domain-containing response regulator n=1 Tax=Modestobacter sp. VKM Ac-2985 TaxID=3004139 RepID=UPI0022AB66E9|nr:response regulator [Modestobacter sp. VKM Ac-2985]MCZ2839976.1 response regulator [Modestobacter sp. VKM Ac-2985]
MAKVLVVEDEDVTRLMLESRLHLAGHRVRGAGSMDEARALLEHVFTPDVVITDMFMPGGSGLSLASALRQDPMWADLPLIFLSGRALPGDVAAGAALNAAYLAKPVSMTALTTAIDTALVDTAAARDEAVRDQVEGLWDLDDEAERQLHARLLGTFVDTAPEGLSAVEDALHAGDAVAVEETAHKLRGSASTLGAGPLAELCATLEEAARAGRLPTPGPVIGALRRELEVTCRVFTELAAELAEPLSPAA